MPSLLEALERKYFTDCEFDEEAEVLSIGGGKAGAKKRNVSIFIPRLPPLMCVPELLVLNDCDIDCAGNFETIKEKCQRVRELDLAQNKLEDWTEVFHILRHMPRIEFLNLSKNHLMGPICQPETPSISNLRGIVLNGTYLDWAGVDVLLENLPLLEELHLSLNNYREVLIDTDNENENENENENCNANAINNSNEQQLENANCDTNNCCQQAEKQPTKQNATANTTTTTTLLKRKNAHKALKTLHFTGNPVEQWQEVCRLGRVFPSMEQLVLADCPIQTINIEAAAAEDAQSQQCNDDANTSATTPHKYFNNLVFLNLSYTNIATWADIDMLAKFPKLRNLRVKNWPLWERLECTEHERRQLLIARLPNVQLLNGGGAITADERESAERAFIRYYMAKPEAERPQRYIELVAKHGQLDPLVHVNLKPDKRVEILLTYGDTTESRLVDIYRSVADFKTKLEKIIGLPANKMRLYYVDQDYKDFGPEEMKYPNKLLYSYNIQNGDEIIIDAKK